MPSHPSQRPPGEIVVCRCENVTLSELRTSMALTEVRSINQLKKLTRAGMGACQGRTCARALAELMAAEVGIHPGSEPYLSRPPVRQVTVAALAAGAERYTEPKGPVQVAMTRAPEPDRARSGEKQP